tara:strand:- start:965 stop:1366 length:402 start_codon:yes stop_codon:yes gene_type:complete
MSETSNLRATFSKNEDNRDVAEITIIGDPNTMIYYVKDHSERLKKDFPNEWAVYFKEKNIKKIKETDLSILECMSVNKIKALELEGITSVEQLSELSDGACHGLGKGTLDYRKEAKAFIMEKHNIKPLQVVGS